jgi:hypothetical protein
VRRFWPALKARVPSGNLRPDWGQGLRGRELCLVVRFRRAVDRRDSESPTRSSRVFARVRRTFFDHATHPKAPMRVTGVVGVVCRQPSLCAYLTKCKRVTTSPS